MNPGQLDASGAAPVSGLSIGMIEPEQADTELTVVDHLDGETTLDVRVSRRAPATVRLECATGVFIFTFDLSPESARELGNHLLLCADVLEAK